MVLEVWRLLQKEMKLQHSELEGVALEVLGVTAPTVPPSVSAALWAEAQAAQRRAAFEGINSSSSRALPHAHRQSLAREAAQAAENSVAVLELCMARSAALCVLGDARKPACNATSRMHSRGQRGERGERGELCMRVSVSRRLLLMQRLVDFSEVLPRASALARLYGCSLQAALTRGTQFRVECVLLRAAKKRDFVLVSPSKQQVSDGLEASRRKRLSVKRHPCTEASRVGDASSQVTAQAANICVPLILEPRSGFYFDPVLVLDFLSLYPSIVIANNICYSTALGNVQVGGPSLRGKEERRRKRLERSLETLCFASLCCLRCAFSQTDPFTEASKPFGVMRLHAPPAVFREIVRLHKAREQGGDGAGPSPSAVSSRASFACSRGAAAPIPFVCMFEFLFKLQRQPPCASFREGVCSWTRKCGEEFSPKCWRT